MRRTIFMALIAALFLLVPSAARAAGSDAIFNDCYDDGVLQGTYTPSQLRHARENLPSDIDEYSDCRDVLSRAIANASGSKTGGDWEEDSSPSASASSESTNRGVGAPDGGASAPAAQSTPEPPHDPAQDKVILTEGAKRGDDAVIVGGHPVSPGASRLAADVGRNALPGSTVALVVLFALTLLGAALLPLLRRRRGVDRPEG